MKVVRALSWQIPLMWRLIALSILIAGCGSLPGHSTSSQNDSAPAYSVKLDSIPNAVPRLEPRSKYGNPSSYVVYDKRYHVMADSINYKERGIASWYGTKFHGKKTSTGEPYNMLAMTAAHKTLPLPTYAEVTNLENGRQIIVRINDRGPFLDNRIIDLSYVAAAKLGILDKGTGTVEVRAIDPVEHFRKKINAAPETTRTALPDKAKPIPQLDKNRLYLQIGAFSNRSNAEILGARLESLSPGKIHIIHRENSQRSLYQVHMGPFYSNHEALKMTEQLLAMGLGEPHTITYRDDLALEIPPSSASLQQY